MRLGRAAFWSFLVLNILSVVVLTALLPLTAKPFATTVAVLLCLPSGWMGMQRLHDVGRSGWQSWLTLVPLVGLAAFPFAQKLLWAAMVHGYAKTYFAPLARFAAAIMIGLGLCAILLAAGVLRTCFLWLEPGDPGNNRYGPPPQGSGAPTAPTIRWLNARMQRLPFWLLLFGNYTAILGLQYFVGYSPADYHNVMITSVPGGVVLYLPTFWGAVLRLHDRDRTGALPLLVFLLDAIEPFVERLLNLSEINLINVAIDFVTFYLLFQCWQPGDPGSNRYGPSDSLFEPSAARAPVQSRPVADVATTRPLGGRQSMSQGFGRRMP